MSLITYDIKELAKILKCTDSAIQKGIDRSKLKAINTIKVKGQVFYFKKNIKKAGYSFCSIPFETNKTISINIDTDISDVSLNIFINGIKVK